MTIGQIILGLISAVAAITAAALSWWAGRHGRREEWWRRFQWATEQAMEPDLLHQKNGAAVVDGLADSRLAGPDEFVAAGAAQRLLVPP